jgi:phosphoglycolate phosphatase
MVIVFDLDGTLIDSVEDLAASANELATSLGGRSLDLAEVAAMVGDGASILVRRALDAAGVDAETPGALARFLAIYDRRLLDRTVVYPGMREALALASRRARLAVLTNKPLAPSIRVIEGLDLARFFETIIGGDGPYERKPQPGGLLSLIGAEPGAALLVGDSPIDWQTAQAAGCPFVWASYGFGAARFGDQKPDTPYTLGRPSDLVAVLDRVAAMASGT